MSFFVPVFRFLPSSSDLELKPSAEAAAQLQVHQQDTTAWRVCRADVVRAAARARVIQRGGDPNEEMALLAESQLQFGQYRGQTFQWLLSNDVGYACAIVGSHEKERGSGDSTQTPLMLNKDALVSYARLFPPMVIAITRRRIREGSQSMRGLDNKLVGFGQHANRTYKSLYGSKDRESRT